MAAEVPRLIIEDALGDLMRTIVQQHIAAGQMASGRTMKSMRVEAREDEGRLVGKKYFGVLETGRRAGKVPNRFYLIIMQWMKDKGITAPPIPYKTDRPHKYTPEERGQRSMAAAIADRIGKSGTKLYRDGGRDDIYSNAVAETKEDMNKALSEWVKKEFTNIKLNIHTEIT